MDLIKRIFRKSAVVLLAAAALSAFVETRKLPAGIIAGGLLGLANIRGLAWSLRGLLGSQKATGKMIFFSMFRLGMLFVMLLFLVYFKLVSVFGILIGLTIVFVMLLIEGMKYSKEVNDSRK